jgi:hypothetical protein
VRGRTGLADARSRAFSGRQAQFRSLSIDDTVYGTTPSFPSSWMWEDLVRLDAHARFDGCARWDAAERRGCRASHGGHRQPQLGHYRRDARCGGCRARLQRGPSARCAAAGPHRGEHGARQQALGWCVAATVQPCGAARRQPLSMLRPHRILPSDSATERLSLRSLVLSALATAAQW